MALMPTCMLQGIEFTLYIRSQRIVKIKRYIDMRIRTATVPGKGKFLSWREKGVCLRAFYGVTRKFIPLAMTGEKERDG